MKVRMFSESRTKMPRFEVELAASHGIKLEVSKRERLERQAVIDPIPAFGWTDPLNLAAAQG
jgi:hypothetical protein